MLCYRTSADVADALADLLDGHGPQLATRKLLHKHRGTRSPRTRALAAPYIMYGILAPVVKTTIYLPDELHQGIKQAAKERGTSEAELIRTAVRHELLGAPAGQEERIQRRARLLAAMGKLDSSAYPSATSTNSAPSGAADRSRRERRDSRARVR